MTKKFLRIFTIIAVLATFFSGTVALAFPFPCWHNYDISQIEGDDEDHLLTCTKCSHRKDEAHKFEWESVEESGHRQVCSNCGYEKDVESHTLGEWKTDSEGHYKECTICDYETEIEQHDLPETYEYEDCGHWKICNECGYKTRPERHCISYESNETQHRKICSECDYKEDYSDHELDSNFICRACRYCTGVEIKVSGNKTVRRGDTFTYESLPRSTTEATIEFMASGHFKGVTVDEIPMIEDEETEIDGSRFTLNVTELERGLNSFTLEVYPEIDFRVAPLERPEPKCTEPITFTIEIDVKNPPISRLEPLTSSAAQSLTIISTDIGSAAILRETNSGVVTISEKYATEIIDKANGLANFTANTVAAQKVTSIKFDAELLQKLNADSNITEIGIDTAEASIRIKLSEILDKGDITIAVSEVKELTAAQKTASNGAKLYKVEITSSKEGKLTSFSNNIEIAVPYKLSNEEDPYTITIFSLDKSGILNNLKGTYKEGTVYCLTEKTDLPVMAKANPIYFGNSQISDWAQKYTVSMASKGILIGEEPNSYDPKELTTAEFTEALENILEIENDTSENEEQVSRENAAVIIKDLIPENITIEGRNYNAYIDEEEISESAQDAVDFVSRKQIMLGYNDGTFKPQSILTREEAAIVLFRIFNIVNKF